MSPTGVEQIRRRLYEVAARRDGDLAEGALLIAAEEYPRLDVASYLGVFDAIAEAVAAATAGSADAESGRRALAAELFRRRGFAGDRADYYDPRNGYLNEVLDRRCGIPVTLSIVYLAVARRLGQPADGVNAPGHFLVRHGDALVDPFGGGRTVARRDLVARLGAAGAPDPTAAVERLLAAPPDNRAILARVLGNLRANHLRRGDLPRALAAVDRMAGLSPGDPQWLRDRGVLYQRLECPRAAIADFERYCALVPDDPEADVVRNALVELIRSAPTLH